MLNKNHGPGIRFCGASRVTRRPPGGVGRGHRTRRSAAQGAAVPVDRMRRCTRVRAKRTRGRRRRLRRIRLAGVVPASTAIQRAFRHSRAFFTRRSSSSVAREPDGRKVSQPRGNFSLFSRRRPRAVTHCVARVPRRAKNFLAGILARTSPGIRALTLSTYIVDRSPSYFRLLSIIGLFFWRVCSSRCCEFGRRVIVIRMGPARSTSADRTRMSQSSPR